MENENRLGNAGHVKVDWWDASGAGQHRAEGGLQIRLNHLPLEYMPLGTDGKVRSEIQLHTALGQIQLGNMELSNGKGDFDCSLEVIQELLGDEITYEDIWSICIPLNANHQVICKLHEPPMVVEQEQSLQEPAEDCTVEEKLQDERNEGTAAEGLGMSFAEMEVDGMPSLEADMMEMPGETEGKKSGDEGTKSPKGQEQIRKIARASYGEDKWSHLCSVYPKITPFSDSREYLKIGPNDFVIFHQKYYSLIHNSFMLHGYYQYGQLVLCRVLRRGKPLYYLGTPGLYLEQDKQVALMYGFQSFECDSEPAMEGDFGYYMIQVEL